MLACLPNKSLPLVISRFTWICWVAFYFRWFYLCFENHRRAAHLWRWSRTINLSKSLFSAIIKQTHRLSVVGTREMLSSWLAYNRTSKTKCETFSNCCRIALCINRGQTETVFESLVVYFLSSSEEETPHSAVQSRRVMELRCLRRIPPSHHELQPSSASVGSDLHWMNQTSVFSLRSLKTTWEEQWWVVKELSLSYSSSQLQEAIITSQHKESHYIKFVVSGGCRRWQATSDGHQQTLNIVCLVCLQRWSQVTYLSCQTLSGVFVCMIWTHCGQTPWHTCNQVMWGRFLPPAQDTYSVCL